MLCDEASQPYISKVIGRDDGNYGIIFRPITSLGINIFILVYLLNISNTIKRDIRWPTDIIINMPGGKPVVGNNRKMA
jgi:hypothetical protein